MTTATRADAHRALQAGRFDAVVTDLRLPDGTGLDIVRAACSEGRYTPVIVVSGIPDRHTRQDALAAGAVAFFAKPFDAAALAARVRDLVRH